MKECPWFFLSFWMVGSTVSGRRCTRNGTEQCNNSRHHKTERSTNTKINKITYCIKFLIFSRFTFLHFPSPSSSWFFWFLFIIAATSLALQLLHWGTRTKWCAVMAGFESADNQVWVQRERLSYLTPRKDFGRMFQVTKFPLLELIYFFNNVRLIGAARHRKLRYWKWISLVVRWHLVVFIYTYHGTCAPEHTPCQIWHQSCRRRVSLPIWDIIYYYIIAPRVIIKAISINQDMEPKEDFVLKNNPAILGFFVCFCCCYKTRKSLLHRAPALGSK